MSTILDGVIAPWVIGGLGVLTLFALMKVALAWRQRKNSPYFFMRKQAERNLRAYLGVTFVFALLTAAAVFYLGNAPVESAPRVALLANAKPVLAEESALDSLPQGITVVAYDVPETVDISVLSPESDNVADSGAELGEIPVFAFPDTLDPESVSIEPRLPEEYNLIDPAVDLSDSTSFSPLVFAIDINENYEPVAPRRVFGEGFFTVYATFVYDAMADGMAWAWVWRYNGQIVNGGNERWAYGDEGPGWIYYAPPEGFQEGEYTLEVWVNGELFGQSNISVEQGVANQ